MTSLTRWKLCCGVLATLVAYSWLKGAPDEARASQARMSRPGMPLHINAALAGVNLDELVQKLLAARTVEEVRPLAETLGTVGDDRAIDAVNSLVADSRTGIPEAIIGAFGNIGTDHAVDVLLVHSHDSRSSVKAAALDALGVTKNAHAEPRLIEAAHDPDGSVQTTAIYALGALGTDGAVAVLEDLAAANIDDISGYATNALGSIDSPAAHAAVSRLIDSPSVGVARRALGVVTVVDDEMLQKLEGIVKSGERDLLDSAIEALGHAGGAALPTLTDIARTGTGTARNTAISVLATIDTPESLATLRELLEDDDDEVVKSVITALSSLSGDEARDLLISTALSDRTDAASRATDALLGMSGADIEQALVEVVKAHPKDRPDVLRHLITIGNKEGTALATNLAHSSDEDERIMAIRVFAEAGTPDALETALSLVRSEHGETKVAALRMLSSAQPGEPSVTELMRDTIRTGTPEEATAAINVLSRSGTNEARDAVLGALNSSDADVAGAAVAALEKFRMTPESAGALRAVADAHPELARNVMQQLLNMGSPAGVQIAEKLLRTTTDRYEAETMFRALAGAGTPEAAELLVRNAKTGDPEIRAMALRSLSSDKTSLDIATQSLRDSAPVVREAAAAALGSSHADGARDALLQFTRSNDPNDRRTAVNALRDTSDPRITQRLLEMTRDPDAAVSMMAVDALPDTSETAVRLRSLVVDPGVSYNARVRAAQSLRYRGRLDEATAHVADELEATYDYGE